MFDQNQIEGFLSNPLFLMFGIEGYTKQQIGHILENAKTAIKQEDCYLGNLSNSCYLKMKEDMDGRFDNLMDEALTELLVEMGCKFGYFKYFFTEEEVTKINDLLCRKQFISKLIKSALNSILYFINYCNADLDNFFKFINYRLIIIIDEKEEKAVLKYFKPLKDKIDTICTISNKCYLHLSRIYPFEKLNNELAEYVKKTYGYDFNDYKNIYNSPYNNKINDDHILANILCSDNRIWNDKYYNNFQCFINLIEKYNGETHARKVLDYVFKQLLINEKNQKLVKNGIPFYYAYDIEKLIAISFGNYLNSRFSKLLTSDFDEKEKLSLLYPLFDTNENDIQKGKEVFEEFIKGAYKNDWHKILELFYDCDNIIQDKNGDDCVEGQIFYQVSVRDYIDNSIFSAVSGGVQEKYINIICPEFFNNINTLKRLFYRCYLIYKYIPNYYKECMYEYFYDALNMIQRKYGYKNDYIQDTDSRDKSYNDLKEILKSYNLVINDKYKELYITSLLDKKYASYNEIEMFPVLEQLGDAIYELAIVNILFYNRNDELFTSENIQRYTNAKAQIKVAENLRIQDVYISRLHQSLNSKLDYYDKLHEKIDCEFNYTSQNYIADSLEMIIGTIYKEFGLKKALDFTTKIILEVNEDLNEPLIPSFDIAKVYSSNYDADYFDYLNKIYPSRFGIDDGINYMNYHIINQTLEKLLSIILIGNETKEKRSNITYGKYNNLFYTSRNYPIAPLVISYLQEGIEYTVNSWKTIIESNYSKYNK